jgi:hypothetical protein
MILTFKERFVEKILSGEKIHTIRKDTMERWYIGAKIHFWCGNPRNISKNPYHFADGIVKRIIPVKINPKDDYVIIDALAYHWTGINDFARNDGFKDWEDMKQFFPMGFKGKVIIWEQPIKPTSNEALWINEEF